MAKTTKKKTKTKKKKKLKCTNCGSDKGIWETCPYAEEINYEIVYCDCCLVCRDECRDNI